MMGDWINPRARLRRMRSAAIVQKLLAGMTRRKRQSPRDWVSEPARMSQRLSIRSASRPVYSDVSPQMHAAGNIISPDWAALKPKACWRKRAIRKFMAKVEKDSQK